MRRSRVLRLLVVLALVPIGSLVGSSPANAIPTTPLPNCTGGTTPCLQSATKDGVDITADPAYDVSAAYWDDGGARQFNFRVTSDDGVGADPNDLDPTSVFEVVINTGSTYPWETFARGKNVVVTRGGNATTGYTVGFSMRPVTVSYGDIGCDNMGNCSGDPTTNTDGTGYLEGWVDDASFVTDPDDRAAMKGFDLASNAAWVSSPLQLDFATNSIYLDVANTHVMNDGTTVFIGSAEFRLPFAMLRRLYLVDDPATLTASAFTVRTGSGPAPTVNVVVNADDVKVEITNITFSKRRLKIAGDTRPGRPRDLRAARRALGGGILRWRPAKARGSKVRGYKASCVSRSGHRVVKTVRRSPAVLGKLKSGKRYTCVVRAKSRAGLGRRAVVKLVLRNTSET